MGALTEIRFLANEARKAEGLAYAGFETFRGSPYNSCARETGQNSRDAPGGAGPVRVRFRLLHIDRKDVPFADSLEHSVRACLKEPGDEKTRLHLETALKTVSDPVFKVLEIADFNTTGLTGPTNDPHSVFTALVKGDGVTNKPGEDSAGSFGIGKNAAYAISALQTVIYSTRYRDSATGETLFAAQGRLRLISHQDEAGPRSAEGYWGNPDFAAVEDVTAVPAWMARSEIGTTILSMGFIEQPNWAGRMTLSLVTNFFVAIDRGEIEFAVEDTVINAVSLDSILADSTLQTLADETAQLAELERARRLLRCTRSEMASRHLISVNGLGDFSLHLLVEQDLPREVHILRNGIYITDNFRKFAMPLRQFPGTREFSAVLEPAITEAGRAPSALLKQLENPAHDAFEPERITNPDRQDLARRQIKSLHAKVREIIRTEARISDVRRSRLEELSDMFADTQHRSADEHAEGEISPDRYTFTQPTRARRRPQAGMPGDGPGRRRGGGERKQPGARKGGGGGRPAGEGGGAVPLEGVRSRVPNGDRGQKRLIWFTPGSSGDIELAISAAGLADDIQLSIVGADTGVAARGRVRATVTAGERVCLEVLLSEPYDGPVELDAVRFSAAGGAGAAGE
ncbi:hypothetical protein QE419_000900 [Brevundimonas vesicularis]|uniref:hypothetical protein n=1 Tax=Brevundimonas vesicularis TaxID=41276 RepID=UPI002788BD1C|nr:hypothetical protein [Brevundimonas vesicularis]MDQ1192134.1 hypothetical protein [Brevundimonas vesicularis]